MSFIAQIIDQPSASQNRWRRHANSDQSASSARANRWRRTQTARIFTDAEATRFDTTLAQVGESLDCTSGGVISPRNLVHEARGIEVPFVPLAEDSCDRSALSNSCHSTDERGSCSATYLTEGTGQPRDRFAVLLCNAEVLEAFRDGLRQAGFHAMGPDVFVATASGASVEFASGDLYVVVDGKIDEDVEKFVADYLAKRCSNTTNEILARRFGTVFLSWALCHHSCNGGDSCISRGDEEDMSDLDRGSGSRDVNTSLVLDLNILPRAKKLGAALGRQLCIVTYGCHVVLKRPIADYHFCADDKRLRYRLSGREAEKCSGLDEMIQARVCRCAFFATWIAELVRDVEVNNLTTIAIFCWKGRHRSVAAAEILKLAYYPEALVSHLSL